MIAYSETVAVSSLDNIVSGKCVTPISEHVSLYEDIWGDLDYVPSMNTDSLYLLGQVPSVAVQAEPLINYFGPFQDRVLRPPSCP